MFPIMGRLPAAVMSKADAKKKRMELMRLNHVLRPHPVSTRRAGRIPRVRQHPRRKQRAYSHVLCSPRNGLVNLRIVRFCCRRCWCNLTLVIILEVVGSCWQKERPRVIPALETRDRITIAMEEVGTSLVWSMCYRGICESQWTSGGRFHRVVPGHKVDTKCSKHMIMCIKDRQAATKRKIGNVCLQTLLDGRNS